jgi:hypothetical protein
MAKVTIDGKEHDTETMNEDARRQLGNVATCDRKLEELKNETAMIQTARNTYAKSLGEMLAEKKKK